MALTVDTRTATEYGVVRTFGLAQLQASRTSATAPTTRPFSTVPGVNPSRSSELGGGYVSVDLLFIQFAGFTFGKSASAYATPWNGYPGNNSSFLMGGADYVTGVNNIQYTAQFGNGVSATIGLDDPTVYNRTVGCRTSALLRVRPRLVRTPTAARMLRTSSVTSASTRLGVCSRFQVWRIS